MSFNVLIVDDSRVMRTMIRRTLALAGFPLGEVLEAEHGQEALDVLRDHWIDLALVDVNMPVMNGEEFLGHVRADPLLAGLAVVIVSTESSRTRIDRLLAAGAAFVHKPFTPEQLRDVIGEVTGVTDDIRDQQGPLAGVGCDF